MRQAYEFTATVAVYVRPDPKEFRGLNISQIADELLKMANAERPGSYDWEGIYSAATSLWDEAHRD